MIKFCVQPTERSKTGEGKDTYNGFVVVKVDDTIRGAFCPCQGGKDVCFYTFLAIFFIQVLSHLQ